MSSPPAKRGRGRPKKDAAAAKSKPVEEKEKVAAEVDSGEEGAEKSVQKSDQEGSPKRRGRPRKGEAPAAKKAKTAAGGAKKGGKRGRPKKDASPEENGDAKSSDGEDESPAED
ncbi:unnamed protein product [Bursaphelenchus xylophilus]|uniref:(pine wood nematode) hypothetical protein n=1 Tax=Bursaphelenchus xylophilus TaxID=6326 RepID=A0A1I7RWQ7_BURXY|nr:unnamed protein product [Bursaphelenchus xylophilus]CAG9128581.1 unnamed protein product [Bursaphelenchus xylophilus]